MSDKNKILYKAIQQGDNKTMKELLYKDLLPKIIAFVNVDGDKDDAFDLFQDAVIMMVKKIRFGEFSEEDDIMSYMFISVRNRWINKVKRDSRSSSFDTIEYSEKSEDLLDENELKRRETNILEMFDMLGEKCSKLLKLLIIDEKSTEEVALELDMSGVTVVKTSKNRCKKRLIKLLEDRPDIRQMLLKNDWRFGKYI